MDNQKAEIKTIAQALPLAKAIAEDRKTAPQVSQAVQLHDELHNLVRRMIPALGVSRTRRMLSSFVALHKPDKAE